MQLVLEACGKVVAHMCAKHIIHYVADQFSVVQGGHDFMIFTVDPAINIVH